MDSEGRGTFSPSLSLCCSFSDASQCAINLLLIRLKHLSQKQEAALLCLERGPNKSSNWQVNLTALPPTPLDSFLSRNYHFAPTAQVWGVGEANDMVNHLKSLMLPANVDSLQFPQIPQSLVGGETLIRGT